MSTEIYLGNPSQRRIEWITSRATKVKYTANSGLPDWYGNINGELSRSSIPNGGEAETIDIGPGVTSIGEEAFSGCSQLTSVKIPDSVTSIGEVAFDGCDGLTSVAIGAGVTSIGEGAFSGCGGLTSVEIPDGVRSIGRAAFFGCHRLANVTIPDSVETIGNNAFTRCNNIEQAFFAGRTLAQVKAIPDADGNWPYPWGLAEDRIVPGIVEDVVLYTTAENPSTWSESTPEFDANTGAFNGFAEKSDAVKIIIPSKVNDLGVTSIGDRAFRYCRGLTSVTIPNSVTSIGGSAFYGCSGLTSVTIPNSVTSIGGSAFYGCSGLTSVTIGNCVTSIGYNAFFGCNGLSSVKVPQHVCDGSMRSAFPSSYQSIANVVILDGATRIGDRAFYNCVGLINITIPDSVVDIHDGAFSSCSGLASVAFSSKTADQVRGMANYSWGLKQGCVLHCSDGDITP